MNRRAHIFAVVGAALILASAWAIHSGELPSKNFVVVAGACRMPVTVIEPMRMRTQRATIVLHGLAANRSVMRLLGENLAATDGDRVYLVDLPGHGDNTSPFSFERAEECAAAFVEKLVRDGEVTPRQTAIVGHSMGGAIAIRLADRVPVGATVALSPAPMKLPRRMPSNLLVFSAQFDFGPIREQAEALSRVAGGDRVAAEDFEELRAFRLEHVAWGNHHSVLDDANVAAQAATWIQASLNPKTLIEAGRPAWTNRLGASFDAKTGLSSKRSLGAARIAVVAPVTGMIGIILLFPAALKIALRRAALSAAAGAATAGGSQTSLHKSASRKIMGDAQAAEVVRFNQAAFLRRKFLRLGETAVFAFVTILIVNFVVPLRFLYLYSGDYLVSLLLIFGLLVLAFDRRGVEQAWNSNFGAIAGTTALGFAFMLASGAWMNWRLADLWLKGARWWRFAALVPFCFVFGFAEEVVLGPIQNRVQRASRFGIFLLLRFEIWFAAVFAFYALASGRVLVGVLAPALAGFSVLQRIGADEIRVRSGSAVAAAVFSAILAAWFIAAVFPLT